MENIRKCFVCGVESKYKKVCLRKEFNMYLCDKHYFQKKKYGDFLDCNPRGVFDKNEIRIFNNYIEVDCYDSYGNVKATFLADVDDINIVKKYKWKVTEKTNKLYVTTMINKSPKYYHRMIMKCENLEVDHINGNSLDNRKSNLRLVNRQEQMHNLKPKIDNTSGIRGVSKDSRNGKYTVDFIFNKTRVYFKNFDTIQEACFVRYICESILNKNRFTENDHRILKYISEINEDQKISLFNYTLNKLKEKFNFLEELKMQICMNEDKDYVKMMQNKLKENNYYCPCSTEKNEDTKCMCKEFRDKQDEGFCHCMLYYKVNNE